MILFIIFVCLFFISSVLLILSFAMNWNYSAFLDFIILFCFIASGSGTIISAALIKPDIKAIEYPASEYNFKIKVVEFEENRDTILVVIPKEK